MKKNASKPVLTISLLASNRPDTIRRCLDSLRPIREAIPSELILVDTSKNQDVHNILLEYTDLVYEFEWCNDFAKARNVGLKKAKGEWFMFLDDDEWFVDAEELIQFFASGEYKQYGFATHRIRNFVVPDYSRYSDGWVSRLYRIDEDSAFHSKIHEHYMPIRGDEKCLNSMSYHSGYIFTSAEQEQKHYERNVTLLHEMIQEEPENMRWKMQLVQEYAAKQECELLEETCKEYIQGVVEGEWNCTDAQLCCFWSGYVDALGALHKHAEALARIHDIMAHPRCIEAFKWQLYYRYIENYFHSKDWDNAKKYAELYIEASKDEEKAKLVDGYSNRVLLLGETFDWRRVAKAYAMWIVADLKLGSTKQLCENYEQLPLGTLVLIQANGVIEHLVEAVGTLEYEPIFVKLIGDAYRNKELRVYFSMAAEQWKEKDEKKYRNILFVFAQVESDDEYIWHAKLQVADWSGDKHQLEECLWNCFAATESAFSVYKIATEIAEKHQIDVFAYWKAVEADNWKWSVRRFFAQATEEEIRQHTSHVQRVFEGSDWKRRFYEMVLYRQEMNAVKTEDSIRNYVDATYDFYEKYYRPEEELISLDYEALCANKSKARENLLTMEKEDYDQLIAKFYQYMVAVLEYYLSIFKDETFGGDLEILPPEARAAVWLNEFFGKDEADYEGQLFTLRECAKACLSLGERIKELARLVGEKHMVYEQEKAQRANDELDQMLVVMKEKIHQMVEQGMYQEAYGVLKQVLALAPEDKELNELESKLRG